MKSDIINGLFAIGGALIGVIGTWFVSIGNKEKQRIALFISPCSKLLEVENLAKSDVQITYRGKSIEELMAGEVATQNTGTMAIENIEIDISPGLSSPLLDLEASSKNFTATDDFIDIQLKPNGSYNIRIKYLNPKDRVIFYYRIAGKNKPTVSVRKIGLDVELKREMISWIPDIYAEVVFGVIDEIPIPGYPWIIARINKPYRLYLESKRNKA
jgi:hypothetical protein